MIGVFSQKAKFTTLKSFIYLNEKGEEVEVTAIYSSLEEIDQYYKWKDKIVVGEVFDFVGFTKLTPG